MKKLNKVEITIILLVVVSAILILPTTYTIYKENTKVSVSTKSGELIYDVTLDDDSTYLDTDKNTPYFFITVTNEKNSFLTDVDFNYTLTIKNKNGSPGLFTYIDDNNNESAQTANLTIEGTMARGTVQSKQYKVYVYSTDNAESTVEYDIDYEITQKRME